MTSLIGRLVAMPIIDCPADDMTRAINGCAAAAKFIRARQTVSSPRHFGRLGAD